MDDVIEQKRDVMPSAWVPKGGEKRAAKGAGRVRGSQEAPANGAKGGKKTLDEAAMTPFLREITLVSSGGAFLDGYVLSLIGVALTQITAQMSLTTHWTAAIGASVLLGILVWAASWAVILPTSSDARRCSSWTSSPLRRSRL